MKIIVIPGHATDATSLYRSMGPLGELRKTMPGLEYRLGEKVNWATLGEFDAVFLQRPYKGVHVTIAELAKATGKPVWIDYDDDLFSVPLDNPAHEMYEQENTRRNVAKLASIADIITVSTAALKARFDALNGDVRIVPNAWNEGLFGKMADGPGHLPNILWRGSSTHQQDVLDYAVSIVDVAEQTPRWSFTFIGWKPYMCVRYMRPEQAHLVGHLDPIDYHQFIRKIFPAICIVPLVNNAFNQAKSNIAWIEATSAGAVTLAPDMPEWRRPGVVLYNDADTFRDRLLKLIAVGNEGRAKVWNASRRWIEKNLTLATVNELRRDVIEDLELLGKNEKWRAHAISRRGLAIETEGAGPIASKDALGGGKEATQAAAAGDTRAPEMVAGRDPGNG